jgi:hypothetical protein
LSKISERLTKLGQTERSGFGFGARAANTKIPVILVGTNVDSPDQAKDLDADLIILAADSSGAAQTKAVDGVEIWGVSVSGGSSKDLEAAVEAGADFIIVEGESAPGSALIDDDSGKGFVIGDAVSDERAKAIDAGPWDFLVLDGTSLTLPLSVGSVLDVQEQLAKYSRHIFLQMSEVPDKTNLELLRDIGISALIYDANSLAKADMVSLRESIELLEPKKQKSNAGAILPQSGESGSQDADLDDNDQDHDDEDWE